MEPPRVSLELEVDAVDQDLGNNDRVALRALEVHFQPGLTEREKVLGVIAGRVVDFEVLELELAGQDRDVGLAECGVDTQCEGTALFDSLLDDRVQGIPQSQNADGCEDEEDDCDAE